MDVLVFWLIIAVVLGVAEIFTLTAALGLLGFAALITSMFAALGLPMLLQFLVFAIASVVGFVVLWPIAARHMLPRQLERSSIDALAGRTAYVVREIAGCDGAVRIGGEVWTARALDESQVIPAGAAVDVIQIDGATAVSIPTSTTSGAIRNRIAVPDASPVAIRSRIAVVEINDTRS